MGPTWVLLAPDRPHVGPMNLAIRDLAAIKKDKINGFHLVLGIIFLETPHLGNDWLSWDTLSCDTLSWIVPSQRCNQMECIFNQHNRAWWHTYASWNGAAFKKSIKNMLSAKCWPFCFGLQTGRGWKLWLCLIFSLQSFRRYEIMHDSTQFDQYDSFSTKTCGVLANSNTKQWASSDDFFP